MIIKTVPELLQILTSWLQ